MIRRATALAGLAAALMAPGAASASPEKPAAPAKIVYLGTAEGTLAATSDEAFEGVKAALAGGVPVELTRETPKKPRAYDAFFADLEKRGVVLAFAFVADGETPLVEKAAEKSKVPLLVLSPEETRQDIDPNRAVFWAGGLRPTDEALYALDFLLTPLGVHEPAVFHDGSARALAAASKCAHLCQRSQRPREPSLLAPDFGVADVKGVLGRNATSQSADATAAGESCDGILYFGGPAGAERICAAAAAAKIEAPILLGQGAATRAVPHFVDGSASSAWALEAQYVEDWIDGKGSPAPADAAALAEVAKTTDGKLFAATVRGWRAGRWVGEALRNAAASTDRKPDRKFLTSLRGLMRRVRVDPPMEKQVFEPWGHATLARFEAWHAGKWRDEPPFTRTRPGYMPIGQIPQVGFFDSSRFKWEPGSYYVWMHWGKPEERTIEKDLAAVGLDPGPDEPGLRERVVDDLLGRTMSRLNRLFLRNADGTAIPGVSFNVTFGAEKEPRGLKGGHRFEMVLRGDSEIAGGVAHGTSCEVFTTYIRRTIYAQHALKPPLSRDDVSYLNGTYKWGMVLERNLRGDAIRALHDGFTQGFALTGAHECGHMFGLDHDTTSPRSIMNVNEAVGLDFEWAEWAPEHVKILETRLGRVPVPK